MKLIKTRTSALFLAAVCVNFLGPYRIAVAQTSYPLYCHGPLQTTFCRPIFLCTPFKWSKRGARR